MLSEPAVTQTAIEIAKSAKLKPILELASQRLGVPEDLLEPYGRFKAKLSLDFIDSLAQRPSGRLILVTAISPTPAGEGKTTTTVGLGDALNGIGQRAMVCLREPSMGPVFGVKGGAAGGGYAQIVPMEDINLHFTGDFAAIAAAHNLLAALLDNHIHHGNALDIDVRRIAWRRVIDMNDRSLRQIVGALGGPGNGYPRQDGFDIVVASEVMAILCLAESRQDLKRRLGDIVVAHTCNQRPVTARDLQADGAMTVLLKDAFAPNLVQTLEHNLAFVHGGPFANIAHGCNSVLATRTALKLADYVVTEAGFGADLGAEKFINIKCRQSGLRPAAAVIVATVRALKYHGGVSREHLRDEDLEALSRGLINLERHVENVRDVYGLPCVVSINRFDADTEAELALITGQIGKLGVPVVTATHWAHGGAGAVELARIVVELCERPATMRFVYDDADSLWTKVEKLARGVYRAAAVEADQKIRRQIDRLQSDGYGQLPICVAKTQSSFSTDPNLRGAPTGHTLTIREVRLSAGAGFIVLICGDVMTMPGLPAQPAAERIDLVDGQVVGLF